MSVLGAAKLHRVECSRACQPRATSRQDGRMDVTRSFHCAGAVRARWRALMFGTALYFVKDESLVSVPGHG
jgi:hypothetical protein